MLTTEGDIMAYKHMVMYGGRSSVFTDARFTDKLRNTLSTQLASLPARNRNPYPCCRFDRRQSRYRAVRRPVAVHAPAPSSRIHWSCRSPYHSYHCPRTGRPWHPASKQRNRDRNRFRCHSWNGPHKKNREPRTAARRGGRSGVPYNCSRCIQALSRACQPSLRYRNQRFRPIHPDPSMYLRNWLHTPGQ